MTGLFTSGRDIYGSPMSPSVIPPGGHIAVGEVLDGYGTTVTLTVRRSSITFRITHPGDPGDEETPFCPAQCVILGSRKALKTLIKFLNDNKHLWEPDSQ